MLGNHALTDHAPGGEEVLADERLAGVALAAIGMVYVLGDHHKSGVARLLDGRVQGVRHGDGRDDRISLIGNGRFDQIGRTRRSPSAFTYVSWTLKVLAACSAPNCIGWKKVAPEQQC